MTLLDICEPLLQYICQLKRMGGSGGHPDYLRVRNEIKGLLADIGQKASADGKLAGQYRKLELSLMFFTDSMISNSRLPFAAQWHQNRLAYEQKEKAGDEKYFDLLDATLQDSSEEAEERLAFFYVCLGLGFAGMHAGQPEPLCKYMNSIFPRIRHRVDYDPKTRLCEDAYKTVDTRSFLQPPGNRILGLAVVMVFLSLCVLVLYYGMYMNASDTLRVSLQQVIKQDQSAIK
jgi:type IV/VI secretion system ImpK/VasF family protein